MSPKRLAITLFVLLVLLSSFEVFSYVTHTGSPSMRYLEDVVIKNLSSSNSPKILRQSYLNTIS